MKRLLPLFIYQEEFLYTFFLICFLTIFTRTSVFAQSACPAVSITPSNVGICNGCTNLTAHVQGSVSTTSYSVSAIPYVPFSFNTGTPILVNIDDQWSNVITIPFCFQFYGNTYNQLVIGSNEIISFDLSYAGGSCPWNLSGAPIPTNTLPTNSIMGPYQDIDPTNMGNIYWQITGTAPCRTFVVSFFNTPYFGDPNSVSPGYCTGPLFATSQIVFYETTNIIDINIQNKPDCNGWNSGFAIEGIQNAAGTNSVTVPGRNRTVWTANNDAYRFTPTGAPQYNLTWYDPANTVIGTSPTISVCPTITTTYRATIVNTTCSTPLTVSATATVTVNPSPAPVITANGPTTFCSGGSVTLDAGSGYSSYSWSNGAATQTINVTASSTLTITVTNSFGCTGTASMAVLVKPVPFAIASSSSQTLCSGDSTSIALSSFTPGTTFSWTALSTGVNGASNGSGVSINQTLNTSGTSQGTVMYTITPTANSCIGNPINVIVTVNPVPSATAIPATQTICSGSTASIALTSNVSGTAFTWTVTETGASGGTNGSGSSITDILIPTGSVPGTAVYIISSAANGCSAPSDTVIITVNPNPGAVASATPASATVCSGDNTAIALNSTSPGTTFSWTVSQAGVSGAAPGTGALIAQTLTITSASQGTAVYTITPSVNGCSGNQITVTITVNPIPAVSVTGSAQTICSGNADSISITSNLPGSTFMWTALQAGVSGATADSGAVISQILIAAGSSAGTAVYNIIAAVNGCQSSSLIYTVTVKPAPVITALAASHVICTGGSTPIVLSSNLTGTNFSWTAVQTGVSGASPGSGSNIGQLLTLTGTGAGTASYMITSVTAGCIGAPITITVTVNPLPVLNISSVVINPVNCHNTGGSISNVLITSGQNPFTYHWKDSLGSTVGTSDNLGNTGAGKYTLTVTDSNGCSATSTPFTIGAAAPVTASFSSNPMSGETPLTVAFTNNSVGASTYFWTFGTGDTSTVINPTFIYIPLGTFTVCLIAVSSTGCRDTACAAIEVHINSVFIIPNVFSPNGDGVNDVFAVKSRGLKTLDAEIFNRWGEKLYEWHTTGGGWDGRTASGVLCTEGTYYFILNASGIDEKKYFEKGSFSLVH